MLDNDKNLWLFILALVVICFIFPPILGLFLGLMAVVAVRYIIKIIIGDLY